MNIKYLPFLVYKENGRKKPIFLIEWEISPDNPFYEDIYSTSKYKTISGLFVAELKYEKKGGEPLRLEDVKFWRELNGWPPENMEFDEEKYHQHLISLPHLTQVPFDGTSNKE